eukprot:Platyproteum_vivax@DN7622_c0_g2_i11.p1
MCSFRVELRTRASGRLTHVTFVKKETERGAVSDDFMINIANLPQTIFESMRSEICRNGAFLDFLKELDNQQNGYTWSIEERTSRSLLGTVDYQKETMKLNSSFKFPNYMESSTSARLLLNNFAKSVLKLQ